MALFKKNKPKNDEKDIHISSIATKDDEELLIKERDIREVIAPDGLNPYPTSYMIINDKGVDVYVRCMTINTLPKRGTFANTFHSVFNYEDSTASVFIEPMLEGTAIKHLDKRVKSLESEVYAAEDDRNRGRKMRNKLSLTEEWAEEIEGGENKFYQVSFLFTIYGTSLNELNIKTNAFVSRARIKGIEVVGCYAVQPEAFLSNGPYNHIYYSKTGPISNICVKKHIFDKYGLSTIFCHTSSGFSHKDGAPLGRNMDTGELFLFDPFDKSHDGYAAAFAGATGTGKSATIKMASSRLSHYGVKFACVDSEKKGSRGEYSLPAEEMGGASYEISVKSKNIVNLYEIDEQIDYDEITDTEYRALHLMDKLSNINNIYITMIKGVKEDPDFRISTYLESIIQEANLSLFNELGIYEGQPDSLYTEGQVFHHGKLVRGKVKKELPTISKFFMKILRMQQSDQDEFHREAYTLIIDSVKFFVRELIYRTDTLEQLTPEKYEQMIQKQSKELDKVAVIRGNKPYYDGQSTIKIDKDCVFVNIDIADLPENDRPINQEIALNFLEENFIKKNSENIKRASKMVVIFDEAHRTFAYPEGRKVVSDIYRTARKRHVGPWTCTQGIADYDGYKETESILNNCDTIFLFKHREKQKKSLMDNTSLTVSQIERIFSLGGDPDDEEDVDHKGEVCIIDNKRTAFIKVDYLKGTEQRIVETNITNLKEMAMS